MNDIENKCRECGMNKICRKDGFSDDPEKKIPECFRAAKTIQNKAQRDLADEVIMRIGYDMEDRISSRTLKIITLINTSVIVFEVVRLILHFAK